jgi:DNA mismatch endonuclease, patch repair protein
MDRVTREIRSKIMASVRSSGNRSTERRIELVLRKNHLKGFRRQWDVAGKPDFAWPKLKVALFIDGCFWHGCPRCDRPSKSNVHFWKDKVLANQRRDRRVARKLRKEGWKVLRVWECAVDTLGTLARLQKALAGRKGRRNRL